MGGYRYLDHTSDAYVEAYGENLSEAFEEAAKAMFNIMSDTTKIEQREKIEMTAEGHDLPALLYNWLERLIHVFDINAILLSGFNIEYIKELQNGYALKAHVAGEQFNPEKHTHGVAVKGVTYWLMEIQEEAEQAKVRFVLDL